MENSQDLPSATVLFRCLRQNRDVPIWRQVVSLEESVEAILAKMSAAGAAMVRSQYAIAMRALEEEEEEGQWETAESSLLRCREALKDEEARVGNHSYGLLRLWAEFPLAQMYQMRGGAEMLQKAVDTWRELFDGENLSMIKTDINALSFLYTAEYDCGCANEDSVMKDHALRSYRALRGDDAERELCLLLSYDYYWFGRFQDSLKWIERANDHQLPGNRNILPLEIYLRWEVVVLMKLQRFDDARSALDSLSSCQVPLTVEAERRAEEVRRWKEDVDMQELQYAIKLSLTLNSNDQEEAAQSEHFETATPVKEIMDEMLTRDTTSVRSWLSFNEHFKTALTHINSVLPGGPKIAIKQELGEALKALEAKHFDRAVLHLNRCREILRIIKKCISENEAAYYSILAAVDHLLAGLYQFCEDPRICQMEKALEIRKELLYCMQHIPNSSAMEQHYIQSLVILTEYQGSSEDVSSREQIVESYASLMDMKNLEQAECDMCFWLFFCDKCPRTKLHRLTNEVMPRWEHSGGNHSLTYTHLMRCVVELSLYSAELLIGKDGSDYVRGGDTAREVVDRLLEQAESNLFELNQCSEGQSSHRAWVDSMLAETYQKRRICAIAAGDHRDAVAFQQLAQMHMIIDQNMRLHEQKKPPSIAVSNKSHLIQAEERIMKEHYWVMFPAAHYVAFQKLYEIGHDAQVEGDWERAIFNLELCRDLLKQLEESNNSTPSFDSILVWIDVPLVQLYHMKTKNLRKSLDLRQEMKDCINGPGVDPYVQLALHSNLHATIYHLGLLNYPSRLGDIMSEIMKVVHKSKFDGEVDQLQAMGFNSWSLRNLTEAHMSRMQELMQKLITEERRESWEIIILFKGPKEWEYHVVTTLVYWHFVQGDYESGLEMIGVLKQVVENHFPEDETKKDLNAVYEATCLMELKMFQDAEMVLKNASGGRRESNLCEPLRHAKLLCESGVSGIHGTLFETSRNISNEPSFSVPNSSKTDSMNPLFYLRITGFYCQYLKRYKDAVVFHTACTNIIEAANKKIDPSIALEITYRASNIVSDYRGLPGWYDYYNLGISYRKMFETRMRRCRESLWTHPHSFNVELADLSILDTDFTSSLRNYQQQLKLVVIPEFVARANHEILKLYATMNDSYFSYLLNKYGFKNAHAKHLEHGIAEDENHLECKFTSVEQSVLEQVEAMMVKYGRRTLLQFANSLYAMKGRYTESWINMLEGHKDVYTKLQTLYLNKMFLEAAPDLQIVDEYRWKAFLYAERQRSRVLLYQMGPQKRSSRVARELWEFDTKDVFAMGTLRAHVAALEKDSVFVEYNLLQDGVWIIYVVQAGVLSHYLLTLTMDRVERAINDVVRHLNGQKPKKGYSDDKMNEDLEDLHDLLIKPIASHLSQMELHHKLILAPSELLAKVPFAALRDRTGADKKKQYLLQRHTISLVPSLRVFQRCNERLQALQQNLENLPSDGPGAIVALGDPTYGENGNREPLEKLSETEKEVEDIAEAFPEVSVVKLLGEDATADKLLHWVANPGRQTSRQIIVHIGAHGEVNNEDERNNCLFLARTSTRSTTTAGSSTEPGSLRTIATDDQDEDLAMKITSDEVEQTIRELKKIKDKKKAKKETKESKEKEKGKAIELVSEKISAEPHASEYAIMWANDPDKQRVRVYWKLFAEQPELKTKPTRTAKDPYRYGPHICSVLTLKDIVDSKTQWRAELVVLGACHTSEGKATAEGLVNLARGFIIAGVPCVVASQWAVPDASTRELMAKFYKALRHGRDVASSLQSAMAEMIQEGLHMRAWAPFVIWGSPSLILPECLQCQGCQHCRRTVSMELK